jgi:hypothetical protein
MALFLVPPEGYKQPEGDFDPEKPGDSAPQKYYQAENYI